MELTKDEEREVVERLHAMADQIEAITESIKEEDDDDEGMWITLNPILFVEED